MTRSGKLSRKQKKAVKNREEAARVEAGEESAVDVPVEPEPEPEPEPEVEEEVGAEGSPTSPVEPPVSSFKDRFSLSDQLGRKLALGVIALVCCLVYAGTLKAPFVFDDLHNFLDNPYTQVKDLSAKNLWDAASKSPSSSHEGTLGRFTMRSKTIMAASANTRRSITVNRPS